MTQKKKKKKKISIIPIKKRRPECLPGSCKHIERVIETLKNIFRLPVNGTRLRQWVF